MKRSGMITLFFLAVLLLPAAGFAQKDTRETREASKFIGLAMTKQSPEEQAQMYEQAMEHLRKGMAEDAGNAQVWLLAGSALAALGNLSEADQAFNRAVELHPEYAEQVQGERETAWVEAFNTGIQLMDQQRYDEAITALEGAQIIYKLRPEALMNLGALYANAGDPAKAEQALLQAIDATNGPLFEQLDDAGKAEWVRFRTMAKGNIAQILAQQGIEDFQAEQFDSAAARFLRAAEINPQARDYWFNYGQALWAQSTPLEESLATATKADSARIQTQLQTLYGEIRQAAQKSREFDPNNEVLYLMEARTHRMAGEFDGGANREAGQAEALRLLTAHDALPVLLNEINVAPEAENSAKISGSLTNAKLAEGESVKVKFTLLDIEGAVIGEQEVTVTAPAAEAATPFEATVATTGEIAGWKYVVTR